MKQRRMHPLLMISLPAFIIFGSLFITYLISGLRSDPNIWWTAGSLPLDHPQSRRAFELFINGQAINQILMENSLAMVTPGGQATPVSKDDITVRLNSWQWVKSRSLGLAALFGFLFGACLVMVIIGMILPAPASRDFGRDQPAPPKE